MNKNSYVKRHLKEGTNNFKRNGWMTVASISSLSFMLLMIGVTFLILLNLNYMTTKVEQNVEIHAYLQDSNSTEKDILTDKIQSLEHVASVQFISKNEGLENFMENLGDEGAAFETLKKDNPLNDAFVIKTEQPQDVTAVAEIVQNLDQVDKVEYGKNVVGPLFASTKLARILGTIFIICLTLMAVHLVTNTIRLTVLARKEEIQLRKLIGATNQFIRIPFFIEGALVGFSGAMIASIIILFGYYVVYDYMNQYIDIAFIELISPFPLVPIFSLTLLIFGIFIGIWGAVSSLRQILKV